MEDRPEDIQSQSVKGGEGGQLSRRRLRAEDTGLIGLFWHLQPRCLDLGPDDPKTHHLVVVLVVTNKNIQMMIRDLHCQLPLYKADIALSFPTEIY